MTYQTNPHQTNPRFEKPWTWHPARISSTTKFPIHIRHEDNLEMGFQPTRKWLVQKCLFCEVEWNKETVVALYPYIVYPWVARTFNTCILNATMVQTVLPFSSFKAQPVLLSPLRRKSGRRGIAFPVATTSTLRFCARSRQSGTGEIYKHVRVFSCGITERYHL